MGLASILQNFAGGGINNGLIRNFTVHYDDIQSRNAFLTASFIYGIIFSLLMMAACLIFPETLADVIFGKKQLSWVFILLAALSIFSFIASYFQSLMTARGQLRRIFNCQLYSWIIAIPLFIFFAMKFGTSGAISGIYLNLIFLAILYVISLKRQAWFIDYRYSSKIEWKFASILIPFTLIALVIGFLSPSIYILLRSEIESKLGWEYVGYWQSLLKISEVCFSFLSMVVASSYFPVVSKSQSGESAYKQTTHFLLRFMPGLFLGLLALGLLSKHVLTLIFSSEFSHLYEHQRVLLAADFFRAAGWVLSYLLMARNHLVKFLILETASAIILYVFCLYGLRFGFEGLIAFQAAHSLFYTSLLSATVLVLHKKGKL